MNITELKELAEKATPGPWVAGDDEDSDYFLVGPCGDDGIVYQSVVKLHSETNADYIAAANPAAILELIAKLEDAQGEIRALRATEAGLRERVKELEEGLRLCVHTIELANWGEDFTAINARALLEKKE